MDLLIDSNVILDRILKRQPFFESAENVFKLSKKADINSCDCAGRTPLLTENKQEAKDDTQSNGFKDTERRKNNV